MEADSMSGADSEASADANASMQSDVNVDVGAMTSKASASIRALLAKGGNTVCTVSGATSEGTVSGTVYLSGGKMRGDFKSTMSGSAGTDSHMITTASDAYVWTGSQGAKMSLADLESNANAGASASSESKTNVSLDQKVDYDCKSWSPDNSKFAPPASVNFVDLKAMMQGAIPGGVKLPGNVKVNADGTVSY
jgi:hypothetical protein